MTFVHVSLGEPLCLKTVLFESPIDGLTTSLEGSTNLFALFIT